MSNYEEKEAWFSENSKSNFWNFKTSSASAFYRDLFPEGTFENRVGFKFDYEKTNKGNGFIVYTEGEKKHTRIVFDDLAELYELQNNECAFMSPISYFGRNRTAKNARYLYALAFDLDEVGRKQIDAFFGYHVYQKHYPRPTYVVNSGGGVHLYYVFKEPIPMIPKNQKALKILKYELTTKMWNEDTSGLEERQYQGLNQGFRLVGSRTKHGETVTAWKTGERVTVEELAGYIPKENARDVGILYRMWNSTTPLEEARKKWPEWYEQRIVMGRKKSSWTNNRKLYDWWLKQAPKASYHHRYWYIFALTVYAAKCDVLYEELEQNALNLVETFNNINPEDPFTEDDVYAALKAYNENHKSFTRKEIAHVTAIDIEPNKRNGRKQAEHLEGARALQAIKDKYADTNWREGNGRPSKEIEVYNYLQEHPFASKAEVIRETGLSKKTVYKYYEKQIFIAQNEAAEENHINAATREFG
ncbi:hypothetical protein J6Z39_06350 [bacterium]|nr:hypothetical protein [bacterium]